MLVGPQYPQSDFPANHRVSWLTLPKDEQEQKEEKMLVEIGAFSVTKTRQAKRHVCNHPKLELVTVCNLPSSQITVINSAIVGTGDS